MSLFSAKRKPDPKTNALGESLDCLTEEGDLPFGWVAHNQSIVNQIESELSTFRNDIHNAKTPIEKYAALKSYLLYIEDGEKHYGKIGICAGKYFEEFVVGAYQTNKNIEMFATLQTQLKNK